MLKRAVVFFPSLVMFFLVVLLLSLLLRPIVIKFTKRKALRSILGRRRRYSSLIPWLPINRSSPQIQVYLLLNMLSRIFLVVLLFLMTLLMIFIFPLHCVRVKDLVPLIPNTSSFPIKPSYRAFFLAISSSKVPSSLAEALAHPPCHLKGKQRW